MEYGPYKPTRKTLYEYLPLGILHIAVFVVVYGFTNHHAAQLGSDQLLVFFHPWELKIPFVPEWFFVYASIGLMLWMPLFFVPLHRVGRYTVAQILATLIAGTFFYLFPFDCGFSRSIPDEGGWHTALTLFYAIDKPHNLVPSLHIGYSTVVLLFSREHAQGRWYIILHLWTLAIYASVLFTHQHHVIDILTGIVLSLAVYKIAKQLPDALGRYFAKPEEEISQEATP